MSTSTWSWDLPAFNTHGRMTFYKAIEGFNIFHVENTRHNFNVFVAEVKMSLLNREENPKHTSCVSLRLTEFDDEEKGYSYILVGRKHSPQDVPTAVQELKKEIEIFCKKYPVNAHWTNKYNKTKGIIKWIQN